MQYKLCMQSFWTDRWGMSAQLTGCRILLRANKQRVTWQRSRSYVSQQVVEEGLKCKNCFVNQNQNAWGQNTDRIGTRNSQTHERSAVLLRTTFNDATRDKRDTWLKYTGTVQVIGHGWNNHDDLRLQWNLRCNIPSAGLVGMLGPIGLLSLSHDILFYPVIRH